jgi:7-carboxy-7-deazaguanine synthase
MLKYSHGWNEVFVSMKITETFLSVQGEGPRTGMPCFFIRTAGCNLDCQWCDTSYAHGAAGQDMSVAEIMDAYARACTLPQVPGRDPLTAPLLVCVTGGEPMLQPEMPSLLTVLIAAGAAVDLMTNGTIDLSKEPAEVRVIMDVKVALLRGSSSGDASTRSVVDNAIRGLGSYDAVKFVVQNVEDFKLAAAWAVENDLFTRVSDVFVAPAWGDVDPATVADWILGLEPRFRLGLQLHKYIWGSDTRK